LVRPTTLIAGTLGYMSPVPRNQLALSGIQIVKAVPWSSKPFVFRNPPYTVGPYATDAQKEVRGNFAREAHALIGTKGKEMYKGKLIPAVAARLGAALKGKTSAKRLSEEELRKRRRSVFSYIPE